MNSTKVLISGASITGPALGYWLSHYGFDCTIVERAPELRKGGYAIDVRGAAIEVIKKMGLYDKLQALDTNAEKVTFVDKTSKELLAIDADIFGGRQHEDLEIMRGDIAEVLYNATKNSCHYIWGDSIASLTETDQGIHVTFEQSPPQTFDIVIGADGVHSNVRRLAFGDETPFVKSLGAYISIATIPNTLNLHNEEIIYGVNGKSVGVYTANNNQELKAMFLFNSPVLSYDRHDSTSQKKIVADIFTDEQGWKVPYLLEAMQQTDDFYLDQIAQVHLPQWSKGRVVVAGDAAHCPAPASGQGTSIALVGAYVLAGELKQANGDFAKAFTNYQTTMQAFIDQNMKIAPITLKGMIAPSQLNLHIRNAMFHIPKLFIGMNKQVMNLIQKAATAIQLKNY